MTPTPPTMEMVWWLELPEVLPAVEYGGGIGGHVQRPSEGIGGTGAGLGDCSYSLLQYRVGVSEILIVNIPLHPGFLF